MFVFLRACEILARQPERGASPRSYLISELSKFGILEECAPRAFHFLGRLRFEIFSAHFSSGIRHRNEMNFLNFYLNL